MVAGCAVGTGLPDSSLGDALTHSRVPLLWPIRVRGCRWAAGHVCAVAVSHRTFGVTAPTTGLEILPEPAEMGNEDTADPFCRWVDNKEA